MSRLAALPILAMERAPIAAWRVVFVLYAIALTTGTHWPVPPVPQKGDFPLDKCLHLLAFGGGTGLLTLTRWLGRGTPRAFTARNIARCVAAGLLWAGLDEATQYMPGVLQRKAQFSDYAANAAGVLLAGAVAMLFARVSIEHPSNTSTSPV